MTGPANNSRPTRRALLAGATGLVGQALLEGLLADPTVSEVVCVGRRPPSVAHPKLKTVLTEFPALPPLPAVDEAYLALGTTLRAAGSRQAFRAVDFDASVAVGQAARAAGATRIGVVSAMGADPASPIFYNRVKGEFEAAIRLLEFSTTVIARPSLLLGERSRLGQPARAGERLATSLAQWLRPLVPSNYLPIAATDVASALLAKVPVVQGYALLLSGEMQELAWQEGRHR